MNLAPIVLFVYNRPWHTEQTLCALAENELAKDSILYIYADGPKESAPQDVLNKINETRSIIKAKQWCKEVHIVESQKNKGLATSVIEGVTAIVNKHEKIIVLEDDLITSKGFLKYMNDALNKFSTIEKVMQISGHCFPANNIHKSSSSFFIPFCTSWGWGTWKRAWDKFDDKACGYMLLKSDKDLEKRFNLNNSYSYSTMLINQMESATIDSWAIRWWWSFFKANGIALFPDKSLVKNIGFGVDGTHTHGKDPFPIKDFDPNYFINKFPADDLINENYFEQIKSHIYKASSNVSYEKKNRYIFIKKIIRIIKMNKIKKIIALVCPPIIWKGITKIKNQTVSTYQKKENVIISNPNEQDLDIYWDPKMAEMLETWGENHVWNEIQMLLANSSGKVLDIACGTGVTINIVAKNNQLQVHGCDISDFLIEKAINRGIKSELLKVCDATNMDCYKDNSFDYSYSIGSLEHFTDDGILKFVGEIYRITNKYTYHMVPVSITGVNHGWIKTVQSYYNNSEEWWIEKFKSKYKTVKSINSGWKDEISIGMWFICSKN